MEVMNKKNSVNAIKQNSVRSTIKSHKQVYQSFKNNSFFHKKAIPALAVSIFFVLFTLSIWMFFTYSKNVTDAFIVKDLSQLEEIFKQIDQDCKITGFDHIKNYVDFLTVKEFVGSQVGAMKMSYPKNWKGPYLLQNPTVLEQSYIVLKNKKGYYLVPGDGVVLTNGKIIGRDIILNDQTDIELLMQDVNALKSSQGLLVRKIQIESSYIKQEFHKPLNYLNFAE